MPSIWKPGSNAGRAKASNKSIRGTISGPIPIFSTLDDDHSQFPVGSLGATGTGGIASPTTSAPTAVEVVGGGALKEQLFDNRHHDESSDSDRERAPDSGLGENMGGDIISQLVSQRPKAPSDPPPLLPPNSAGAASSSIERQRTPQRTSPPQTSSPLRTTPVRVRTTPSTGRITNPPQSTALRYSTISDTPSAQTNNSKGQPQRKQSTLRSALGKLFGRGKKKNGLAAGEQRSPPNSGRESALLESSQHKSDPSALHRTAGEMSPKRSASLPISELDRPLRSHSIGPDDIRAIESARNSLQADIGGNSGSIARRRAAAANANERRFLFVPRFPEVEIGAGLSPRPASSHGRGSRLFAGGSRGEHDDPSEIGRAITSDSGSHGMRRRSRSLSGLPDILGTGIGRAPERRRSDEIRYWRESYNAGFHSPLSSDAHVNADVDDVGVADLSVPASPTAERPPDTPPQPFNFGSISKQMVGMKITQAVSIDTRIGTLETRTGKLERVVDQLCHVVPGFRGPLSDISAVGGGRGTGGPGTIRTVSDGRPSFTYTAASPPPPPISPVPPRQGQQPGLSQSDISRSPRASSERQSMDSDTHSLRSFGEAQTFIGSLHPPSSSATQAQSLTTATTPTTAATLSLPAHPEEQHQANDATADDGRDRPTSNSTVRGVASMPSMHENAATASISEYSSTNAHNPTYYNQYHALLSQLEAERQARQALEGQVKKLSDRLNALSSTTYALVRDSGSWGGAPDPSSPRSVTSGGGRGRGHPPTHIPSVFDYAQGERDDDDVDVDDEDEDLDDNVGPAVRHHEVSVVSQAKLALVAKPTSRGDRNDDEAEDFQTPREEFQTPMTPTPVYTYGAFSPEPEGESDGEEATGEGSGGENSSDARAERKQKKAARTLSLSQLTMGKRV